MGSDPGAEMNGELKISKASGYSLWLKELKEKIRSVQVRAALAANRELILFYWELGENISRKLAETNWGAKVIDQLAKDLSSEFPGIQGFSRTNLYYVKKFYDYFSTFSENEQIVPPSGGQIEIDAHTATKMVPAIVPQIGGQLPWGHIKILLDKVSDHQEALFYTGLG